ncbi:MAG: methyltransferase domain-containing protein [Nocardioides sp.]|uniref:methyltransferase domain-containing protein n=1 Tax=Nocardioides sp. TaxID=35761 RepID=UPI0039E4CAEC
MSIEPDTKDWTWVLDRPCPECGFDAAVLTPADIPGTIEANAVGWTRVLAGDQVTRRPRPDRWSTLEYACHVRDVHRVFDERVRLMLGEQDPLFANWDQDAAAVEGGYDLQDPAVVSGELVEAANAVAASYRLVGTDQWARTGRRSNGSTFTVDSLGRYHLHDVIHHLHDVGFDATAGTIEAYDTYAEPYAERTPRSSEAVDAAIARFVGLLPPRPRVLEIGSGPGWDALALGEAGCSVRCTDVTPSFVEMLRGRGLEADLVDPLTDDLRDPADPSRPYDGVWANASLLHVERFALGRVLARLAEVSRPEALLHVAVKEGDGDGWSEPQPGRVNAPRLFTYWREEPLAGALSRAGWQPIEVHHLADPTGEAWLDVLARRR